MLAASESIASLLQHRAVVAMRQVASELGGIAVHLVGGALRDRLLGRSSYDLDVTVGRQASRFARGVAELLRARVVSLGGDRFSALRLVHRDVEIDLWDRQGGPLIEDLARRDLTINSMALDLMADAEPDLHLADVIVDPFDGLRDLEARMLRATTDESFSGDPLRILRLARFAAQLHGFQTFPDTVTLARAARSLVSSVASERIRQEIGKLLSAPWVTDGLAIVRQLGLEPGLWQGVPAAGLEGPLDDDLWSRMERFEEAACFLEETRPETFVDRRQGRLAIIMVGVAGGGFEETLIQFHRAGFCSARDFEGVRRILGFGQLPDDEATLAQRLHAVGARWPTAIAVAVARTSTRPQRLVSVLALIERRGREILDPPRWVDGTEAAERLGIPPGRTLGDALQALRSAQIEGHIRSRKEALAFLDHYQPSMHSEV